MKPRRKVASVLFAALLALGVAACEPMAEGEFEEPLPEEEPLETP